MAEQSLPLQDGPVAFAGAVSVEPVDGGLRPWRIPYRDIALFEEPLRGRTIAPAGVRLTCQSDTGQVALDLSVDTPLPNNPVHVDLLVDGTLHQRRRLEGGDNTARFDGLPEGEHRLELYLPQNIGVVVKGLRIDGGATARPWEDPRPRWIAYGSSITQCGAAAGPSETWPALVANRFDLNLTCLGFGGQCHLDPVIARMIRDLPADYVSLCLGINVMGHGSLSPRTFRAAVLGVILTIRDGHPDVPIACVSPICNPPRETTPNAVGCTLASMREQIAEAVQVLRDRGDANLHYTDGLSVFGPEHVHHMPDELHPDAEGYRVLAERYAEVVMPTLGGVCDKVRG